MIDLVEQMLSGKIPQPPIARLVGFRLVSAAPGRATVEFQAEERHHNPMGTLHGGVLCDVVDFAMGMSYASRLRERESFTTIELKINFLKPVWTGQLLATAKVVKKGRMLGLVQCDIVNEERQLIARAIATCMTLRDEGVTSGAQRSKKA